MTMNSVVFSKAFVTDPMHQIRWNSFLKKKKALIPISMEDAIKRIRDFVQPLLEGITNEEVTWNPFDGSWK